MPHDPKDTSKLLDSYLGEDFFRFINDPKLKKLYSSLQAIANQILTKKGEDTLRKIAHHICDLVLLTVQQEVIEDFHHHYKGDRGYEPNVIGVNDSGVKLADSYINGLQTLLD